MRVPRKRSQQGSIDVRVESAGPQLTRVQVTIDGKEHATLEAAGFTVTVGESGTTIRNSGQVTVRTSDGTTLWMSRLELQIAPGGTSYSFRISGSSLVTK